MSTLPRATRIKRTIPPGSTTEDVRGVVFQDVFDPSGVELKLFDADPWPAVIQKIAHGLTSANAGASYPDDGTGLVASDAPSEGTSVQLASGVLQGQVASLNPRQWLLVMASGPAIGMGGRIIGWVSGTQTVTLDQTWGVSTYPRAGDKYRLLPDLRYRSRIIISGEFSGAAQSCVLRIILYDFPIEPAEGLVGTARKPRRYMDLARTLSASAVAPGDGVDVETAGYYVSDGGIVIRNDGYAGAKVLLVTGPGAGTVDLFAAGT